MMGTTGIGVLHNVRLGGGRKGKRIGRNRLMVICDEEPRPFPIRGDFVDPRDWKKIALLISRPALGDRVEEVRVLRWYFDLITAGRCVANNIDAIPASVQHSEIRASPHALDLQHKDNNLKSMVSNAQVIVGKEGYAVPARSRQELYRIRRANKIWRDE